MLNVHFKKAATAVKTMTKSGSSMFGALLQFAYEHKTNGADALRDHFKAQEKLALAEMKAEMTKNSTYKVAKGKLIKAVELGIALVDADGEAVGKTALEDRIKAAETLKAKTAPKPVLTPAQEFAELILVAGKTADKLTDADLTTACSMVSDLYKKLADRLPMLRAA